MLQTLTLMQKRADDPREVAALARRQERELRAWLAGARTASDAASFAAALRSAAEKIEDDHRVAVEIVIVGDCELDERGEAVIGAAREALLNAAKHAPEPGRSASTPRSTRTRSRSSSATAGRASTSPRCRADRRGVRESIIGRMERAGGRAEVRLAPRRRHRGRADDRARRSGSGSERR